MANWRETMKQRLIHWGIAAVFVLPLLVARPAVAAEVNVVLRAVGEDDPFVISWVDTKDGKVDLDDTVADQISDLVAGVQYLFTDTGQLLLADGPANDLKTVFPALNEAHNEARTFTSAHLRTPDRSMFLDGTIERSSSDPTRGFAQWTLTLISADGGSASSTIQQNLAFPAATPAPNPTPTPTPPSTPDPGTRG
jgi:hypothetical protein